MGLPFRPPSYLERSTTRLTLPSAHAILTMSFLSRKNGSKFSGFAWAPLAVFENGTVARNTSTDRMSRGNVDGDLKLRYFIISIFNYRSVVRAS